MKSLRKSLEKWSPPKTWEPSSLTSSSPSTKPLRKPSQKWTDSGTATLSTKTSTRWLRVGASRLQTLYLKIFSSGLTKTKTTKYHFKTWGSQQGRRQTPQSNFSSDRMWSLGRRLPASMRSAGKTTLSTQSLCTAHCIWRFCATRVWTCSTR